MTTIRSKGRAILLALLLILLPVAALAATAAITDGFVGWSAIGGASPSASTGGSYSMTGAAGQTGGQAVATGGSYRLNAGYVPLVVPEATQPPPPTHIFSWLPLVTKGQ